MAFRFNWPEFDKEFYTEAKCQLEAAMNKGNKPSVIVDHITVKELNMGTKAPELEILEIGELGNDKFRGIFKLNYSGDAYIEVQTKVQANPMHAKSSSATESLLPRHFRPGILAADQPLVVPMILRISQVKLRGIVVLVVSKQKGVTLVFKNDPLESIRISSTFDSVPILRDFLQRQIEAQLRNMLQEDLPVMIHNLSLRYIQSEAEKKQKLEQQERINNMNGRLSAYSEPLLGSKSRIHSSSNSSAGSISHLRTRLTRSNTASTDFSLPELDMSWSSSTSTSRSPSNTPIMDDSSFYLLNDEFNCHDTYMPSPHSSIQQQNCEIKTMPMTTANLFSHNKQLSMMNQLGINACHPLHVMMSPSPLTLSLPQKYSEEDGSIYTMSSMPLTTTTTTITLQEIYENDADAPWYATEGPELYHTTLTTNLCSLTDLNQMMEKTTLDPSENVMAARLLQLTKFHYTLSPLTEVVSNCTFRSMPHIKRTGMVSSTMTRNKVPKRRVTKLNMSILQI